MASQPGENEIAEAWKGFTVQHTIANRTIFELFAFGYHFGSLKGWDKGAKDVLEELVNQFPDLKPGVDKVREILKL